MPNDGLLELDVGELEGVEWPIVRERFGEFLRNWRGNDSVSAPMPGGESLLDVLERARPVFDALVADPSEGTGLLVTHNFVVKMLVVHALAMPGAGVAADRYRTGRNHDLSRCGRRARAGAVKRSTPSQRPLTRVRRCTVPSAAAQTLQIMPDMSVDHTVEIVTDSATVPPADRQSAQWTNESAGRVAVAVPPDRLPCVIADRWLRRIQRGRGTAPSR